MVEINEKKIEKVNQENNEGTIEQVNHESTIDINNLEFDDYVDVPKMRKMELLNEEWGTSKNALKGTLSLVDSNIYFIITDVRTLDDQIIRNPFTKKRIESVYCIVTNEQIFKEEFKKFNKKEVAFKYLVPNKDKNIDESNEDSNEDST